MGNRADWRAALEDGRAAKLRERVHFWQLLDETGKAKANGTTGPPSPKATVVRQRRCLILRPLFRLYMCCTCVYAWHMSKMIQVRNVPDGLHRALKAQAALAGMSLSDFLLAEIRQVAERPSIPELRERMRRRSQTAVPISAAEAVRHERDAR